MHHIVQRIVYYIEKILNSFASEDLKFLVQWFSDNRISLNVARAEVNTLYEYLDLSPIVTISAKS